jgi:hypothetical protein
VLLALLWRALFLAAWGYGMVRFLDYLSRYNK